MQDEVAFSIEHLTIVWVNGRLLCCRIVDVHIFPTGLNRMAEIDSFLSEIRGMPKRVACSHRASTTPEQHIRKY